MPRIDYGWLAIDISTILRLTREDRESLVEGVLGIDQLYLVTEPSPVYVKGPRGSTRVMLGIGSLVMPPDSNELVQEIRILRPLILARPEWVTSCRVTGSQRVGYEFKPSRGELAEEIVYPLDIRDPLGLFLSGKHVLIPSELAVDEVVPVAVTETGKIVVGYSNTESKSKITIFGGGGEAVEMLEYLVPLYSRCDNRRR
ncbi:MAG: hypothetical protein GSR81_03645 [Desulfurococcales archaeon]|nr:hypothetical protein [Desulfurococcales archaeon]